MEELVMFLILPPVNDLKEILVHKINKLIKHTMDLGEFIIWLGCWFYISCWVGISIQRNWWSTSEPKISEGAPFRINKYMSRTRFEGILSSLCYTDKGC